ncbi:hypothetical protein FCM35_KLT19228 [Carex littledalei]|uniref:Uncharacterized protein n=1 Tax=Carex littledalei TaxID=544730 RepID=A0A833VEM8_9POAL|nr:hypothetical protein FCM35_KLT19228 [Carex littledalei]
MSVDKLWPAATAEPVETVGPVWPPELLGAVRPEGMVRRMGAVGPFRTARPVSTAPLLGTAGCGRTICL